MITEICEQILDWICDRMAVVAVLLILFVVGGSILFIYAAYKNSQSETFTLRKLEWTCTATHREATTVYVQSGKVLVPITTYHDVCDAYARNK